VGWVDTICAGPLHRLTLDAMVAPDTMDCPGSGPEPSEALPTPVAGLREHNCELAVTWTGNTGVGISDYRSCSRDHEVSAPGKSSGGCPVHTSPAPTPTPMHRASALSRDVPVSLGVQLVSEGRHAR